LRIIRSFFNEAPLSASAAHRINNFGLSGFSGGDNIGAVSRILGELEQRALCSDVGITPDQKAT